MKIDELMIGDWYLNSDGDACKVIKNFGTEVWGVGNDISNSTDNPQPIQLTEGILKANGFYHDGSIFETDGFEVKSFSLAKHEEIWMYIEKEYIDLRITTDMKEGIIIHYVHELQHALCLVGLNKVANNFKIK